MEFFEKAKAVKLRSPHNKYLVSDDDQHTVRQSRNGSSRKARWLVEPVEFNPQAIRLKSCHGAYLTASNSPFLLGFTGNKVLQTRPDDIRDQLIEWEPVRDGFQVKLTAFGGTCLRANGGTPPWRNSVTHDSPSISSTRNWTLWDVEVVEIPENEELTDYLSKMSSFSSLSDELFGSELGSELGSPVSIRSTKNSPMWSFKKLLQRNKTDNALYCSWQPSANINKIQTGMDLFENAKAVRLRGHHDKYLHAEEDEESVNQDRNGSSKNARWTVELADGSGDNIIRLKSCYGKYLTASNHPFLLGMTGRKVLQTSPEAGRLDSSMEWEPIREGHQVKLKTRYGHFLRANGGLPPWRNSVTHDIPHRTATQDWILWDVDIVEIVLHSPQPKPAPVLPDPGPDSFESDLSSPSTHSVYSNSYGRQESNDSLGSSPPKAADGRVIYYSIADEHGNVDEGLEGLSITFKGNGVDDLTRRLEDETGLEGIIVCSRSPLNGTLYQLRLQLPPNNVTMHVVVVQSSSTAAGDFAKTGFPL